MGFYALVSTAGENFRLRTKQFTPDVPIAVQAIRADERPHGGSLYCKIRNGCGREPIKKQGNKQSNVVEFRFCFESLWSQTLGFRILSAGPKFLNLDFNCFRFSALTGQGMRQMHTHAIGYVILFSS